MEFLYLAEAADHLDFIDSENARNSDELDPWGLYDGRSLKKFPQITNNEAYNSDDMWKNLTKNQGKNIVTTLKIKKRCILWILSS